MKKSQKYSLDENYEMKVQMNSAIDSRWREFFESKCNYGESWI